MKPFQSRHPPGHKSVLIIKGVLISGVMKYTSIGFGTATTVLFIEVFLSAGYLIRGVPLQCLFSLCMHTVEL